MSNVPSLLYSAKKYLVSGLVSKCVKVLDRSATVDTICDVLQQCILFHEGLLKKKALSFIYFTAAAVVFSTEGFMRLSRDALKTVAGVSVWLAPRIICSKVV